MAQYIKQGNIFGRIGTGFGKGLAEQLPKEIERNRLSSSLEELGKQKDLTPFQQYTGLVKAAHEYPQVIQGGSDLLRQQAIIDNINQRGNARQTIPQRENRNMPEKAGPSTITSAEGAQNKINPYVAPSGEERENLAEDLYSKEPLKYRTLDEARNAVDRRVSGDIQQSESKIRKAELQEKVQEKTEGDLQGYIDKVASGLPETVRFRLKEKAVNDVSDGNIGVEEARNKYGQEGLEMARQFANIASWGNLGLVTNSPKELITSIKSLQKDAKEKGYQKEAAESMIADNGTTPNFSYAAMYPVKDIKPLNDELKSIPKIDPRFKGVPGMVENTQKIYRRLGEALGKEGSPLAVAYELEKKGYDAQGWKDYLTENQKSLNLTSNQIDELGKPQPTFMGWLNDWWLRSFSGVE